MKHLEEYRDPRLASKLLREIRHRVSRPRVLMEVCGGQTHGLLRHGIDTELEGAVELIHGPGCPVCVTPVEAIDFAQALSLRPDVTLTSFGDMLRVPGSRCSLLAARASGGNVRIVYSPLDAVELARREPGRKIVFFAVGFETTAPATALAVLQAERLGLDNFSLLVAHVRVQPAMEAIMQSSDCRVQGFLAAGHVCAVLGCESYEAFVLRYQVPVVVTGFEPVDLLEGILECVKQLESGACRVTNRFARTVRSEGNVAARDIVEQVFEQADCPWRGLGVIPSGGLRLRAKWSRFDAQHQFDAAPSPVATYDEPKCRSGEVLSGRIKPTDCSSFGTHCTPDSPLGAPMVSAEGACAAYFLYRRSSLESALESGSIGVEGT
jgi:hydrogenase expression/formation protein HypD